VLCCGIPPLRLSLGFVGSQIEPIPWRKSDSRALCSGSTMARASASSSPTTAARISSSTSPPSDPTATALSSKAIASSSLSPLATTTKPRLLASPASTALRSSPVLRPAIAALVTASAPGGMAGALAVQRATSVAISAT